jgi:RNA-directed DNA polymerase
LKRFKAPVLQQPVIILADNDKGGAEVLSSAKKVTGQAVSNTEPFVHVTGNLYLVLAPLVAGKAESEIEDCFDDAFIKNLVLGGKKFNSDEKADSDLYFSKSILAEHVRENAPKIDFAGFAGIFDRLVGAIEDYEARVVQAAAHATATAGP